MELLEELKEMGADIRDGLKRFAGKDTLYIKMLKKFPEAASGLEVMSYLESGQQEQALANAHTLKGMTGNLSLTPLYQGYTQIVALLRSDQPEEAKRILEEILPLQASMTACIERNG